MNNRSWDVGVFQTLDEDQIFLFQKVLYNLEI